MTGGGFHHASAKTGGGFCVYVSLFKPFFKLILFPFLI